MPDQHRLPELEILKEFENEQEFLIWKNSIENSTNSNFVSMSGGITKRSGIRYKYLDCSRSGREETTSTKAEVEAVPCKMSKKDHIFSLRL